jgi:hypothetical protein
MIIQIFEYEKPHKKEKKKNINKPCTYDPYLPPAFGIGVCKTSSKP